MENRSNDLVKPFIHQISSPIKVKQVIYLNKLSDLFKVSIYRYLRCQIGT